MKVGFLFNGTRVGMMENIRSGVQHDNNFWGMLRLHKYGVEADYVEIEQYIPGSLALLLRKFVGVYYVHMLVFPKLFTYDFLFSSTAFGTQLFFTLFPFRKPRWVMHDFSITGLLGNGTTVRQKVFRFLVTHAAGVVTISEKEAQGLRARFPHLASRIEFVRIGADSAFFTPLPIPEERRVLAPGFDPGRDRKLLLKACDGIDATLAITGRPHHIQGLGALPPGVEAGSYPYEQMAREYSRAAVVVLALDISGGVNDAMGCSTLVEAMMMGKAIVATRTPTMESYITDGENGLLVPAHDARALRVAIDRLLRDPSLRKTFGERARAFALKHCDAEIQAKALAEYFKRLARPA